MKRLTLALMVAFWFGGAVAQDDFVNKMNEIKLSGDYYTAHCRGESEAAAMQQCLKEMMAQLGPEGYDENTVRSKMQHLTKTGSSCRVFVYVRKDALQPKNAGGVRKNESERKQIVFKKSHLLEDASETSAQNAPGVMPPPPGPVNEERPKPVYKEPVAIGGDQSLLSQLVNDIRGRATFVNALKAFKTKKELGLVADYGALNRVPDINSAYIVIFDAASDELSAILSPAASGCKNLLTGTQDAFSNYHGVKAFWFTLK